MYSIYDKQVQRLMSVGRNSATKEAAKSDLLYYVSIDRPEEELEALSKLTPDQLAERYQCQIFKHFRPYPNDQEYTPL